MGRKVFQKLYKHGNATAVTIPRYLLFELGWVPSQMVIVELLEDKSLHVRLLADRDLAPVRSPRIVYDDPIPVTK